MDTITKQLWLVTRIWLVAVGVNALAGAITIGFYNGEIEKGVSVFLLMAIFGGIFSFPVPLVLWVAIGVAARLRINGFLLLGLLYIIGITLTVIVFIGFNDGFPGSADRNFLWLAIGSGIAGITTFYRSIIRWGSGLHNPQ